MNKYLIVKSDDKFIMRFANLDFHCGLIDPKEIAYGGGMFTFSEDGKEMKLWGTSDTYGDPRFSEITDKIHTDEELKGTKIILGNIRPSIEDHREDITDKFVFDEF